MTIFQKITLPKEQSARWRFIKEQFVGATGSSLTTQFAGGRAMALSKLNALDAVAYETSRNELHGAVTHLSPYLRHGCLSLREAFESVNRRFEGQADKLLFEFAWRDYWRRVWYQHGQAILSELEPPKVALHYRPLPIAVTQAKTGLACMDGLIDELEATGYMHNHGRMWLASYVVHHLNVDWRQAADWFESRLLDGDLASNHLSWQWVASTFSAKPYFFNKENLSRFSANLYCQQCSALCPFDASYDTLNARLFKPVIESVMESLNTAQITPSTTSSTTTPTAHSVPNAHKAILVHDEMLSSTHALLMQPLRKLFVFDPQFHGHWALKRLQFVADCLNEMDGVEVWLGDTAGVLTQCGIAQVLTQNTPNPQLKTVLAPFLPIWENEEAFISGSLNLPPNGLNRFSRYWNKAGRHVLGDAKALKGKHHA